MGYSDVVESERAVVSSSAPWDLDEDFETALLDPRAPARGISVRVSPSIWNQATKYYKEWRRVSWTMRLRTLEEAQHFRESLQLVFRISSAVGWAKTVILLQAVVRTMGELPETPPETSDETQQ